MRTLIVKELRDLRAMLLLVLALTAFGVVFDLIDSGPSRVFLSHFFERETQYTAIVSAILAFAIGSGSLVREIDERTIEFLDGLPIARVQIFAAKFVAGWLVASVFPIVTYFSYFALHLAFRGSLDSRLHVSVVGIGIALSGLTTFVVLSCSLLLSYFRKLNWFLLAVIANVFFLAKDGNPALARFNPVTLATPRFEGQRWAVLWSTVFTQLALGTLMLVLALVIFNGLGEKFFAKVKKSVGESSWGIVIGVATTFAIALLAAYAYRDKQTPEDNARPQFTKSSRSQVTTKYYEFNYSSNQSKNAVELIAQADACYETVAAFLGASQGEKIFATLGAAGRHTGGMSAKGKLELEFSTRPEGSVATLAHETSHALVGKLAGSDSTELPTFAVLNEGLATYVESRFFTPTTKVEDYEFIAAYMRANKQVALEELVDRHLLSERRDENLQYPLGLLFVDTLIKKYGDSAPAKIFRSLNDQTLTKFLSPLERWQDSFQRAGFDLFAVADDFYVRLDELVVKHQERIRTIPHPRLGVRKAKEGALSIDVDLATAMPKNAVVVIRFKPERDSQRKDWDGPYEASTVNLSVKRISNSIVHFQAGIRLADGTILYEPWIDALVN